MCSFLFLIQESTHAVYMYRCRISGAASLLKTDSPLNGHQLPIAPHLHAPCVGFIWYDVVHAVITFMFICATALLLAMSVCQMWYFMVLRDLSGYQTQKEKVNKLKTSVV